MDTNSEAMRVLEEISKRNAGALSVCFKLMDAPGIDAIFDFALLKAQNILGPDLWDLYKVCEYDIQRLHTAIMQQTGPELLKAVPGSSFWLAAHKEPAP